MFFCKRNVLKRPFEIYLDFHEHGPFKIHWRLWRCAFLLANYEEVLRIIEDSFIVNPNHVVTKTELQALAISVLEKGFSESESSWVSFCQKYPSCHSMLTNNIGSRETIIQHVTKWNSKDQRSRLRQKLIRMPKKPKVSTIIELDTVELNSKVENAFNGIVDIPFAPPEVESATTILKTLATAKSRLDGETILQIIPQGFYSSAHVLEHHKQTIAELLDQSLADFTRDYATHFISYFRDKILGNFGFYETNDVSVSIKAMVLSAESKVRFDNNLSQSGEGWLAEAEMARLLALKFSPPIR